MHRQTPNAHMFMHIAQKSVRFCLVRFVCSVAIFVEMVYNAHIDCTIETIEAIHTHFIVYRQVYAMSILKRNACALTPKRWNGRKNAQEKVRKHKKKTAKSSNIYSMNSMCVHSITLHLSFFFFLSLRAFE